MPLCPSFSSPGKYRFTSRQTIHFTRYSSGCWTHSASCCQWRRGPPPPTLLFLLQCLTSTSSFSGLRQRTCDDRGVSTGHGDPLLLPCSHWLRRAGAFLPVLGPFKSPPGVLRIYIPAYQGLPLSRLTGFCCTEMRWKRSLCESITNRLDFMCLSFCLSLYLLVFSPLSCHCLCVSVLFCLSQPTDL